MTIELVVLTAIVTVMVTVVVTVVVAELQAGLVLAAVATNRYGSGKGSSNGKCNRAASQPYVCMRPGGSLSGLRSVSGLRWVGEGLAYRPDD